MFNFNTFFQNIVRIFAAVVNMVNTIIQNVTGGEGGIADFMQTFTQNVNTAAGPSPEEIAAAKARQVAQLRIAKAKANQQKTDVFDQQAEAMKIAREIDTSEKLTPSAKLQPLRADMHKGVLTPVLTHEMEALIDLGGSPIFTTLQNMMTHEREMVRVIVDVVGSVDDALSYMLSGWGADEDVEFDKEAAIRYVQQMLQVTPTPTLLYDPCSHIPDGSIKRQCYLEALGGYSVQIMNQQDIIDYPEIGNPALEKFSADQLKAIHDGVQATGERFAAYFQQMGISISPEEAFKRIYGETVEFGYVPSQNNTAQTVTTGKADGPTAPMNPENPIYIWLDDSSFGFPRLDPSFVVVHELGHAFANRHGGKTEYGLAPISAQAFVDATGLVWYPADDVTTQSSIEGFDLNPKLINGQQQFNEQGQLLYEIPAGLYLARGYGGSVNQVYLNTYFYNDTRRGSNPSEGFSDTFANFILNPDIIPAGTTRRDYFDENMPQWMIDIICRDGGCDDDNQR